MYIDQDFIRFYYPEYMYELETEPEDIPLDCSYRQQLPLPPFPITPIAPPGRPGNQSPPMGPSSAPPSFTPQRPSTQQLGVSPLAVDPGAIRPCVYRFIYIWPRRGRGFWAWLIFVGARSVAGFRFYRNNWRYFGMDLRNISSFQCF